MKLQALPIIVLAVFVVSYLVNAAPVFFECPTCKPGHELATPCDDTHPNPPATCKPCTLGKTYSSTESEFSCNPCPVCIGNETITQECNLTTKSLCACQYPFTQDRVTGDCVGCCDSYCKNPDLIADECGDVKDECKCHNGGDNEDNEDKNTKPQKNFIIPLVCVAILLLMVILIAIICFKHKDWVLKKTAGLWQVCYTNKNPAVNLTGEVEREGGEGFPLISSGDNTDSNGHQISNPPDANTQIISPSSTQGLTNTTELPQGRSNNSNNDSRRGSESSKSSGQISVNVHVHTTVNNVTKDEKSPNSPQSQSSFQNSWYSKIWQYDSEEENSEIFKDHLKNANPACPDCKKTFPDKEMFTPTGVSTYAIEPLIYQNSNNGSFMENFMRFILLLNANEIKLVDTFEKFASSLKTRIPEFNLPSFVQLMIEEKRLDVVRSLHQMYHIEPVESPSVYPVPDTLGSTTENPEENEGDDDEDDEEENRSVSCSAVQDTSVPDEKNTKNLTPEGNEFEDRKPKDIDKS